MMRQSLFQLGMRSTRRRSWSSTPVMSRRACRFRSCSTGRRGQIGSGASGNWQASFVASAGPGLANTPGNAIQAVVQLVAAKTAMVGRGIGDIQGFSQSVAAVAGKTGEVALQSEDPGLHQRRDRRSAGSVGRRPRRRRRLQATDIAGLSSQATATSFSGDTSINNGTVTVSTVTQLSVLRTYNASTNTPPI